MALPLRLLHLEDNPSDAELVLHTLQRAGFEPKFTRVDTEQDYRDHLEPAPEIILADFSMPRFDSLRALEIMQARNLDIPFIIVAGTIGEECAVQVMQRGATDYVIKDRLARLGPAVTNALAKKRLRDKARLTRRRLDAQHAITRALAETPNWEMAVPTILASVCQSLAFSCGAFWAVEAQAGNLVLDHFWRPEPANTAVRMAANCVNLLHRACQGSSFGCAIGLPGRVWATGVPAWVPDISRDENFIPFQSEAQGALFGAVALPILRGLEVAGVMAFFGQDLDQPDEEILAMMTALGNQAGQFIDKKRSETALAKEREFLKAVLESSQDLIVACDAREHRLLLTVLPVNTMVRRNNR